MYKNDGVTRRYSEGFKLKILAELSTGKYSKRELGNKPPVQFANKKVPSLEIDKHLREETIFTNATVLRDSYRNTEVSLCGGLTTEPIG